MRGHQASGDQTAQGDLLLAGQPAELRGVAAESGAAPLHHGEHLEHAVVDAPGQPLRSRVAASISRARARVRSEARATSTTYPMAMEATQTRTTLWMVSRAGAPRSTRFAAATRVEARAAHRQPPLTAKASTDPAVQIDGRVGPPARIRSWVSARGVRRMPLSAIVRSAARNRLVQLAAFATLGSVASVQPHSTA